MLETVMLALSYPLRLMATHGTSVWVGRRPSWPSRCCGSSENSSRSSPTLLPTPAPILTTTPNLAPTPTDSRYLAYIVFQSSRMEIGIHPFSAHSRFMSPAFLALPFSRFMSSHMTMNAAALYSFPPMT